MTTRSALFSISLLNITQELLQRHLSVSVVVELLAQLIEREARDAFASECNPPSCFSLRDESIAVGIDLVKRLDELGGDERIVDRSRVCLHELLELRERDPVGVAAQLLDVRIDGAAAKAVQRFLVEHQPAELRRRDLADFSCKSNLGVTSDVSIERNLCRCC